MESAIQFFSTCPCFVVDDVSTTNSVRHRPSRTRGQIKCFTGVVKILNPVVEKRDTKEGEGEEEEDEVTTSAIIRVVIKGVGSVMLLSLFLWLVFLFIYKPPSPGRLACDIY